MVRRNAEWFNGNGRTRNESQQKAQEQIEMARRAEDKLSGRVKDVKGITESEVAATMDNVTGKVEVDVKQLELAKTLGILTGNGSFTFNVSENALRAVEMVHDIFKMMAKPASQSEEQGEIEASESFRRYVRQSIDTASKVNELEKKVEESNGMLNQILAELSSLKHGVTLDQVAVTMVKDEAPHVVIVDSRGKTGSGKTNPNRTKTDFSVGEKGELVVNGEYTLVGLPYRKRADGKVTLSWSEVEDEKAALDSIIIQLHKQGMDVANTGEMCRKGLNTIMQRQTKLIKDGVTKKTWKHYVKDLIS